MGVIWEGFKSLRKLRKLAAAQVWLSVRGAKRTRYLEIPGSVLRIAPE